MTKDELKIVFFGTPDFAVESLSRLVEGGYNVAAVVTMPDKQAGRGHHMIQSDVKNMPSKRLEHTTARKIKRRNICQSATGNQCRLVHRHCIPNASGNCLGHAKIGYIQSACILAAKISWSSPYQLGCYQWRNGNRCHHILPQT